MALRRKLRFILVLFRVCHNFCAHFAAVRVVSLSHTREVSMKAIKPAVPPAPIAAPAHRTRLLTPIKMNGRVVDGTWYMDQPYGEVKHSLPGIVVKNGEAVSDSDTPASLKLDLESIVFLMPRTAGFSPAGTHPVVSPPIAAATHASRESCGCIPCL